MPRKRNPVPSLLRHKAKQLGYIKVCGSFVYLGHWPGGREQPPDEVWQNYQRAVSEHRARGGPPLPSAANPNGAGQPGALTVVELVARWLAWAETYYVHPDGTQTGELDNCRLALRPLVHLYGRTPAAGVGPLKLKAVRDLMVNGYRHPEHGDQGPLCRQSVNARVRRCVRVWRWAVEEELVPVEVYQALRAVRGLPKGRGAAREREPVRPVAEADVEKTLPFLQPSAAAMVKLQLLTGMRPGEVCRLRLDEIDRAGEVWLYRPARHKTGHKGKARVVAIGPKAQAVITGYLAGRHVPGDKPMFSPARDREERFAAMRARRRSKVQPSQASRKKGRPKRAPRDRWDRRGYQQSVKRAAAAAVVAHWHVGQLRHAFATKARALLGLEAAQAGLGHAKADTTQIYAERDLALARRLAVLMG